MECTLLCIDLLIAWCWCFYLFFFNEATEGKCIKKNHSASLHDCTLIFISLLILPAFLTCWFCCLFVVAVAAQCWSALFLLMLHVCFFPGSGWFLCNDWCHCLSPEIVKKFPLHWLGPTLECCSPFFLSSSSVFFAERCKTVCELVDAPAAGVNNVAHWFRKLQN